MSKELVENLYKQMIETDNPIEAKIIKSMYDNQEYKNPMLTEFFNKKSTELTINEYSKLFNKENVGLITDCQIDIVSVDNRVLPVLSMCDEDNNYIGVGLSIGILNKLLQEIQSAKTGLSLVQYMGIK